MRVTEVRFVPAEPRDRQRGLLGYVSFLLDGRIRVDGVVLRRTRAGELRLAFPARRDNRGTEHPYLHPVDTATREALEAAVFEALGLLGIKP